MPPRSFGLLHFITVATDNMDLAVPNHGLSMFEYMKYIHVTWSLAESKPLPSCLTSTTGQNTTLSL